MKESTRRLLNEWKPAYQTGPRYGQELADRVKAEKERQRNA